MRRTLLPFMCALLTLACGGGEDDEPAGAGGSGGEGGSAGSGGVPSGDDFESCGIEGGVGAPEDVSGKWAMLEVASRLAQAPALPDPVATKSVSLYLLDQTQSGTSLTVAGEFCDHWASDPEDAPVKTVIPDSYLVALPPFDLAGSYEVADGVGRYELEPFFQVIGGDIADSTTPLPTEPTDEGVIDEDQDGNPGVTIVLTGLAPGDAFVISRRTSTVTALTTAIDRLQGLLEFDAEENILASNPAGIKELGAVVAPDPNGCLSTIEMVRVADDADCAAVVGQYETLFPGGVARP